jgi:hypothetical protein
MLNQVSYSDMRRLSLFDEEASVQQSKLGKSHLLLNRAPSSDITRSGGLISTM